MDEQAKLYRDLLYGAFLQSYWNAKRPDGVFEIEFADDQHEYARRFFGRLLSTYVSSGHMEDSGVSEETIEAFCQEFQIEMPEILTLVVPVEGGTVVAKAA